MLETHLLEIEDEDEPPCRPLTRKSPINKRSFATCIVFLLCVPLAAAQSTATALPACTAVPDKDDGRNQTLFAVEAAFIPILVILSGILAGLTLGYLTLDMTTLTVLMKTGTPKQQKYAAAIVPVRKNGHLLLITLILANMLINETLPVIADNVFGGGIQAVIASTAMIVVFSEIIPQSICTRYGLRIGYWFIWPVKVLIGVFFIIAWPVSKILTWLLGPHSGMIYRRSELKELVALHQIQDNESGSHGGDLQADTVNIVAGALDFQEKSVADAMTPIEAVFMLDLESTKLDYETLGKILQSGHSRIPVYEQVTTGDDRKSKKIVGVILTKQFILLDPEDAVPLKELPIHPLPLVCDNLPLHSMLNTFQEGRSHMAVVAPLLPQFRQSSPISTAPSSPEKEKSLFRSLFKLDSREDDLKDEVKAAELGQTKFDLKEQIEGGPIQSQSNLMAAMSDVDHPVGIITLEDVLEELIGEEILDEYDINMKGATSLQPYIPAEYHMQIKKKDLEKAKLIRPPFLPVKSAGIVRPTEEAPPSPVPDSTSKPTKPKAPLLAAAGSFFHPQRSRSTPARSRSAHPALSTSGTPTAESTVSTEKPDRPSLSLAIERTRTTSSLDDTKNEKATNTDAEMQRRKSTEEGLVALSPFSLPAAQLEKMERGRRAAFVITQAGASTPSSSMPPPLMPTPTSSVTPSLNLPRKQIFKTLQSPPSLSSSLRRGGTSTPVIGADREGDEPDGDHEEDPRTTPDI